MSDLNYGKTLIKYARESIETYFSGNKPNIPDVLKNDKEKKGVFVTLEKNGHLRGCIGFPEPVYELKKAIFEAARAAAFKDPRFMPLEEDELDSITIEISLLTKPVLIEVEKPEDYLKKIIIGKHGLIIRNMYNSGLLLPQVFTEYKCSSLEALEMVCEKAGLDKDAWKEEESQIYSFEAEIFSEKEPKGEVIKK
ncbi:MAG: TIGR00296 family protein [Candidatus Woesearchaeota archaeon]